jgi:hypothetical protein
MALTQIDGISKAFGPDLNDFAIRTAYNAYIPVTIEWASASSSTTRSISNMKPSPWGIIALEMSSTTDFGKPGIVVSTSAHKLDTPSPVTGLTANQTTDTHAFCEEVLRQFLEISTGFDATGASLLLSPSATNDGDGWKDRDTAYINAAHTLPLPAASSAMPGIFTIGAHNQRSPYEFTSIESAVASADALLYDWFGNQQKYAPVQAITLRAVLGLVIVVLFFVIWFMKQRFY